MKKGDLKSNWISTAASGCGQVVLAGSSRFSSLFTFRSLIKRYVLTLNWEIIFVLWSLMIQTDDDGNLHLMGNDMQIRSSFEGFSCRTAKLVIGKDVPILVGIGTGTDDPTRPCVKIWNIDPSLEFPLTADPIPLVKNIEVRPWDQELVELKVDCSVNSNFSVDQNFSNCRLFPGTLIGSNKGFEPYSSRPSRWQNSSFDRRFYEIWRAFKENDCD